MMELVMNRCFLIPGHLLERGLSAYATPDRFLNVPRNIRATMVLPASPRTVMSMPHAERRRELRVPFSADAEILDEQRDFRARSRVRDLSLGGCYVEMSDPFPPGKNVLVEIYTESEFLETHATVAFLEPNQGMGLTFSVMQPFFLAILNKWLAQAILGSTH
jgi:PilZ domain